MKAVLLAWFSFRYFTNWFHLKVRIHVPLTGSHFIFWLWYSQRIEKEVSSYLNSEFTSWESLIPENDTYRLLTADETNPDVIRHLIAIILISSWNLGDISHLKLGNTLIWNWREIGIVMKIPIILFFCLYRRTFTGRFLNLESVHNVQTESSVDRTGFDSLIKHKC